MFSVMVLRMVRDGYFGFQDYFESLCNTVEGNGDYYLLGADFESYLEAQVFLRFLQMWNSRALLFNSFSS